MKALKNQYSISTDKLKLQPDVIHNFLANESYWAAGITIEMALKRIENSLCFGVYIDDQQIGFARIITDYTSFAYLADVFILPAHRGKGLSKWLLETILAMDEFTNIRRFILATRDMHSLYEKFGFTALKNPDRYMELGAKSQL